MYNQNEFKNLVDDTISALSYNMEAVNLIDPVKYILSIGGKRLRPVLALMSCNLFTDEIESALIPATGLEIFHNFTLIHDDIMDQAPVRRNMATVHSKWDINQAILSGDVMAFIANECFLKTPPHLLGNVFSVYNKAAVEVCVGQQLDMDYEKVTVVSHDEYLRMIELKTAALIAGSAKIGAVLGEADDKNSDLLYEFGRNLGIAFQIQDDLLDIYGDVKVFGKTSGGDIVANKKTFLYVRAIETASVAQRKKLQELFSNKEYDPETKVNIVTDLYDQLGIKKATEEIAGNYIKSAFSFLEKAEAGKERKTELTRLANSLVSREF